jgi:peroxiredoxin family protein
MEYSSEWVPDDMKTSLVIFLHSDTYDRIHQAVSLTLAASSMGWSCHLFLFYQALASYMENTWDRSSLAKGERGETVTAPPWAGKIEEEFESANLPSLCDMLEKARGEAGGLRTYACSSSVRILGLNIEDVRRKVDDIVGLPTMLRITETATHSWYI